MITNETHFLPSFHPFCRQSEQTNLLLASNLSLDLHVFSPSLWLLRQLLPTRLDLVAQLSRALLTPDTILRDERLPDKASGGGTSRLLPTVFAPHPERANSDAAATSVKCIPRGCGPNPCLTLTDKLRYGEATGQV